MEIIIVSTLGLNWVNKSARAVPGIKLTLNKYQHAIVVAGSK